MRVDDPEVRRVDDASALDAVIEAALAAPAYAIDTEFHRERTYFPHVALVQLAWDAGQVALIDPLAVDLAPLSALLRGPGVAVAHAGEQDLEVLGRVCGTVPTALFDTQLAAGFVGFSTPGLGLLVQQLLGIRLPKGDRVTDWTRRPLSPGQVSYAAADVAHLLSLRDVLSDRLGALGRLEWAVDECARLLSRDRRGHDPETAWWRLKESRSLRGDSRAVAQCVAAWREREAASIDVPARFVLPDLAILGIAQRPPRTPEQLRSVRGLDPRHLKGHAIDQILAAIRDGLVLQSEDLRLPPTDEVDRRSRPAVALAAAWLSQLATHLEIDPTLLATRADVGAFIRGDRDARLAVGWRAELAGDSLARLTSGAAALALDGRGAIVLEDRFSR